MFAVAVSCMFTVKRKPGKFDLIQEDDNEILTNTEDTALKVKCLPIHNDSLYRILVIINLS